MCDCIDRMNEAFRREAMNVILDIPLEINWKTGEMALARTTVPVCWDDPKAKKRGQKLPTMLATYCPFCGEKHEP